MALAAEQAGCSGPVAAPSEDMDDVIDVMSLTSSRSDGDEPEYEVEAIRKMVREDGAAQFLVKWKGYDEETWEPEENLTSCKDLLDEFLDQLGSNEAAAYGSDGAEPEYEVEAIRKMVREDGVPKFLVKWKGYGDEDNTWEPLANLTGCEDLLDEFLDELESIEAAALAARQASNARLRGIGADEGGTYIDAEGKRRTARERRSVIHLCYDTDFDDDDEDEDFGRKKKRRKIQSRPVRVVDAAVEEESNFSNADVTLWSECLDPPQWDVTEVTRLGVLELYAGCGGLNMDGSIKYAVNGTRVVDLSIDTVAAIEIEEVPAKTFKHNHPSVNVVVMGVGRFVATTRRFVHLLKDYRAAVDTSDEDEGEGEGSERTVVGMRINQEIASEKVLVTNAKGWRNSSGTGSQSRQLMDYVNVQEARGGVPLRWVEWCVQTKGSDAEKWMSDEAMRDLDLQRQAGAFVASDGFSPGLWPMPGDVHVITGGPPCQGFTGANLRRTLSHDVGEVLADPDNRNIMRFMEAVWLYRPLYLVMEEVPDVADKRDVMDFLGDALTIHGYNYDWRKQTKTGLYGVPQSRNRLIMLGALRQVDLPEPPKPVVSSLKWDQDAISDALRASNRAHFLDSIVREGLPQEEEAAGTGERCTQETADKELEALTERKAAMLEALGPEPTQANGGDRPTGPIGGCGRALRSRDAGSLLKRRVLEWKRAKEAIETEYLAGEAVVRRKLRANGRAAHLDSVRRAQPHPKLRARALVIGDAFTPDLPRLADEEVKDALDPSESGVSYECKPPTPFVAYLRQNMEAGRKVTGHLVAPMGLANRLRVQAVPLRGGACWRDMMGHDGTMNCPKMMILNDAQWAQMGARWINSIPNYMWDEKRKRFDELDGRMPRLKHGWTLQSHRFPMVPYFCAVMKMGRDTECYGRYDLDQEHGTVHSQHRPHKDINLVPWDHRVASVREKARIQGFPDDFEFIGTLDEQYKQLGNAVSPQLAKALARTVMTAHAGTVATYADAGAAATAGADFAERAKIAAKKAKWAEGTGGDVRPRVSLVSVSKELQNFAEFCEAFNPAEELEQDVPRRDPADAKDLEERPQLRHMTYEEMLVAYNTQHRGDDSGRASKRNPFQTCSEAEEYHPYHVERFKALRWRTDESGDAAIEACIEYAGWPDHEWEYLDRSEHLRTAAWRDFVRAIGEEAWQAFQAQQCQHVVAPGVEVSVDEAGEAASAALLAGAEREARQMEDRYNEEMAKGWIPRAPGAGPPRSALDIVKQAISPP